MEELSESLGTYEHLTKFVLDVFRSWRNYGWCPARNEAHYCFIKTKFVENRVSINGSCLLVVMIVVLFRVMFAIGSVPEIKLMTMIILVLLALAVTLPWIQWMARPAWSQNQLSESKSNVKL